MKKILAFFILTCVYLSVSAQFVAKMQITKHIEGICDEQEVYALLPMFKGQEEAICPLSKDSIQKRLNSEVSFLKDKQKYKDKGMIGIIINCKGEAVECRNSNKTKSEELDKQILAVFNSLKIWKAGKLDGKEVDSSLLYSFTIKKGKIILD